MTTLRTILATLADFFVRRDPCLSVPPHPLQRCRVFLSRRTTVRCLGCGASSIVDAGLVDVRLAELSRFWSRHSGCGVKG